uniref:C3H1-type domain-containing protein n=1 Tax=Panagrellus redivivus TaxID=6233 RepID=A0A7E4VG08_PANRE
MDRRVRFDKSVDIQKAELQREREERERQRTTKTTTDSIMQQICERFGNVPPSLDTFCPEEPRPPRPPRNAFSQSMYTPTPAVPRIPTFGPIGSGRPSTAPFNDSSGSESFRSSYTPVRSAVPPRLAGFSSSRQSSNFGDSASRRIGDSYKTSLCDQYRKTKTCNYGENCRYAHDVKELRLPPQANPHFKSTLCRNYDADGTCPFGARCRFVHRREPHHPANPLSTVHTRSTFASSFQVFSSSRAPSPPKLIDFSSSKGVNPWNLPATAPFSSSSSSTSRRPPFALSSVTYDPDSGF